MIPPGSSRKAPTPEQAEALGVVGSSVALSAGAGCGKTFVLAERFVRALEGPEAAPLGKVVALTFTNKAARELRGRIRDECRKRLEDGADPRRWRGVLRGLEAARISTFHSFCGEILRAHALEAGIDPGFTVLDDSIALSIREQALASSFREGLGRRDPDLMDLAVEHGPSRVRDFVEILLDHRSTGDLRDWAEADPRAMLDRWVDLWTREVRPSMLGDFLETARPCLDLIRAQTFENEKVRARMGELLLDFDRLADSVEPDGDLVQVEAHAQVVGLVAKNWPSTDIYQRIKAHFEAIRKASKKLREALHWEESTSLIAARQGLGLARLALKAREAYDLAKRRGGGIDNDDLLALTRNLLLDPSHGVAETLRRSIDLVLVDEFQDTDPIQAEILEAIIGPGLLEGRLFLVGDYKQSIYRFRGARPELFRDYRGRMPEAGRLSLSENFRSVPGILDFVNALFAETFPEPGSALRPGGFLMGGAEGGSPAVEFLWADPEAVPGGPRPDAQKRRREEAERLATCLRTRLRDGWIIRDPSTKQPRRATQGDVAFLFRSLSDASEYEQALAAEGLDYHVVGGSGFFLQQEVVDLINVLTAVDDPMDSVSMAGALRSPFFSISDDALFWLSIDRVGQVHEGLERSDGPLQGDLPEADRPRVARAKRLLSAWRSVKDRVPIASLVDRILGESGYEAALTGEFLGDRKRANARKLVGLARTFDEPGGFALADFVARLRGDVRAATKETQAATTDESGEIIRLMSIHQAKGLEFPIVVIPDLDRKRPGAMKRVAFDPELGPLVNPVVEAVESEEGEESDPGGSLGWTIHRHRERLADDAEALRLFYVATTRARDFLLISSASEPGKSPTSPAMALLDRRFDRLTGEFLGELAEADRLPRVRVIPARSLGSSPSVMTQRPRTQWLEIARFLREGLAMPSQVEVAPRRRPSTIVLDPAEGLSSTAIRLDRLIRAILADPRSLDPALTEEIAARLGLRQDPVAPRSLVEEAVGRWSRFVASPIGREIRRSGEVRRSFSWVQAGPGSACLIRGSADFCYGGSDGLVVGILGDPETAEPSAVLRLLLSARAAEASGWGRVVRAWWVPLGSTSGPRTFDRFDDETIESALTAFLDRS